MKKATNLILAFLPCSFILGYAGAFSLRWFQLGLLYRNLDHFFDGIGTTIGAVSLLSAIIAVFFIRALLPMNKVGKKFKSGEAITAEDRLLAGKTYNKIRILVFIENSFGFIVGQIGVAIIDFSTGVYPFTPSRFAIIVTQAVCIAMIISLYEIYYFDLIFAPYRDLLKIHSLRDYGSKQEFSISTKILISTMVILVYIGVNAFSTAYALINGDNVGPDTNYMAEYLKYGVIGLIVNFIECFGLPFILCLEMKGRIKGITKVVSELEQTGDLSRRINISINDDIGLLTSKQNDLMDNLASTINNLKQETKTVTVAAQILNESSAKSMEALRNVNENVASINSEENKTNEIIKLTYADIESLKDSAQQVEAQVYNQNQAMERASSCIEEMAGNIKSISDTTRKADIISEELRNTSEMGVKAIDSAQEAITLIQQSSKAVQEAVAMIKKISGQTNLLAMNASIEAAHAGEVGKGFAVVADEVRNLASTTAQNLQTVSANMDEMDGKIRNGVSAMMEAKNAFSEINEGVEKTADIVRSIARSVDEQQSGTTETLDAARDVVDSIETIKNLAVMQRQHTDNVYENTRNIVISSNSIVESLNRTSDASRNLNDILSNVDNCVAENTAAIKSMKECIDVFKTE